MTSATRLLLAGSAAVLLFAGCGKSEPPSTKARSNAPVQLPQPDAPGGGSGKADPNEALKERLARQEAASKLFDKAKPEPAPAPRAEPAAKSAPARAEPVAAAKTEPARAEPAKPAEAPPPAAEKKAEPAPAPRTDVAAAKPAAPAPLPALPAARLVSKVDPEFPREAIQAGAQKGNVKVRMTLDANGNVMKVDIVEATPRRVFDRAVVRALSQWRFNDGASGRTVETEIEFRP